MDIVFNELSIKYGAAEKEVLEWFNVFFENTKKIQEITKKLTSIVSSINIKDIQFSNYSVKQWLSKQSKDNKQLLLKLLTNKPLIHNYPDYYFEKILCKGFGYAYENQELCTSFISSQKWDKMQICISKEYFDDNDSVQLDSDLIVNHFSKTEHLSELEKWIASKIKNELANELDSLDGNKLWHDRNSLFPSLVFCEDTKLQLCHFSRNDDSFQQIKRKLFELELYFSNWNGIFDFKKLPFKVTRESDSRKNKLEENFLIKCPDNQYLDFDWHFRFTPSGGRGYFFPDSDTNKCFIGFIGKKINKK